MKIILTEDKMNAVIEKVLKSHFDKIVDIDYKKRKTLLASTSDRNKLGDVIERTIILVTVDNTDKSIKPQEFTRLYEEMKSTLASVLSMDINEYASLYDIQLYAIEKILKLG
jgi:hypothetical protein